jgi:hypothetical protein
MSLGQTLERAHWNGSAIVQESATQLHYAYWNGASIDMEVGIFRRAYWDGGAIVMEQLWPLSIVAPSITAVALTTDSVRITITDNSRTETHWEVHRSSSASFTAGPSTLIDTIVSADMDGTGGIQTYDDTGLSAGTWHYQVLGKAGEALSPASNEVSVGVIGLTKPVYAVGYPKDNAATDTSSLHKFASMDPGAGHIRIYSKVGSDFADPQDPAADGTLEGSFTEAQIVTAEQDIAAGTHGQVVYFQAQFINSGIVGPFLAASASVTIVARVPGDPTGVTQSEFAAGTHRIEYSRGTPASGTLFRTQTQIVACDAAFPSWPTGVTEVTDTASPTDIPVIIGTGQKARSRVRDEGPGGNSSYVVATPAYIQHDDPPGAATGRSVVFNPSVPQTKLDLAWTNPTTGVWSSHEVRWRKFGSADSWNTTTGIAALDSSITVTGVTDDQKNEAEMRTIDDCGGGDGWVSMGSAWTAPLPPASAEFLVNPAPVAGTSDEVGYTGGGPDVDDLEVYYISGTATPDETDTLGGDSSTTGLAVNSQYTFRPRGRNNASAGSPHVASAWVWGTAKSAYTHVDAPQITGWTQVTGACPTIELDLTVSHTNGGSDVRSQAWEYQTKVNSGAWSSWTSVAAGTTSVTGIQPGGTTGDTLHVNTRYQTDTPTDTSSKAVLCTV